MRRLRPWSIGLSLVALSVPVLASTITLGVSSPTKAGDGAVRLTYEDAQGVTKSLVAATGQTRSPWDDLAEGMSPSETAKRYARAIHEAAEAAAVAAGTPGRPPIAVGALGEHVTFTGANGNVLMDANASAAVGQRLQQFKSPAEDGDASAPSAYVRIGTVEFTDGIAGRTLDGDPSHVSVGTDRYVATLATEPFTRLEELTLALVDDLRAHGVRASATADGRQIFVLIDPELDGWIEADTNDRVTNFVLGGVGL